MIRKLFSTTTAAVRVGVAEFVIVTSAVACTLAVGGIIIELQRLGSPLG
jgi:hypothetical protein